MAYKFIRRDTYIADSASDLQAIPEKDMGSTCYVIDEAVEYCLMSTGKWVKQSVTEASNDGQGSVDLNGYATEEYVNDAIANLEIPSIAGLATEDFVNNAIPDVSSFATKEEIPSLDGYVKDSDLDAYAMTVELEAVKANPMLKAFDFTRNPSHEDGQAIYLTADDPQTLQEVLQAKGVGVYNIWLAKTRGDLPGTMIANNTSGRGFACVDLQTTANPEKFIGYAVIFDKNNDMYYRFFNKGVAGPWKHVNTIED